MATGKGARTIRGRGGGGVGESGLRKTHRFAEDESVEPWVGPEIFSVVDAGLADRTADLIRAVN